MEIVEIQTDKQQICRKVLENLPLWFGLPSAREHYIATSEIQTMFACRKDDTEIGMLTLKVHSQWNMEITCMGILPQFHRQGAGQRLIQRARIFAQTQDIRFLTVKTISEHSPDKNYRQTRKFYRAVGFDLFEELPNLWGQDNPCAIYILPAK